MHAIENAIFRMSTQPPLILGFILLCTSVVMLLIRHVHIRKQAALILNQVLCPLKLNHAYASSKHI